MDCLEAVEAGLKLLKGLQFHLDPDEPKTVRVLESIYAAFLSKASRLDQNGEVREPPPQLVHDLLVLRLTHFMNFAREKCELYGPVKDRNRTYFYSIVSELYPFPIVRLDIQQTGELLDFLVQARGRYVLESEKEEGEEEENMASGEDKG